MNTEAAITHDTVEAEISAFKLLESKPASSLSFAYALHTVLELGKMSPGWKAAFEIIYESQPEGRRILYRDSMVKLYLWLKDYHMAVKFLAAKPVLPHELADCMEVYLHLKRFDDAKAIAEICGQRLVYYSDLESQRSLLKIIRRYQGAMQRLGDKRRDLLGLIVSFEERCGHSG